MIKFLRSGNAARSRFALIASLALALSLGACGEDAAPGDGTGGTSSVPTGGTSVGGGAGAATGGLSGASGTPSTGGQSGGATGGTSGVSGGAGSGGTSGEGTGGTGAGAGGAGAGGASGGGAGAGGAAGTGAGGVGPGGAGAGGAMSGGSAGASGAGGGGRGGTGGRGGAGGSAGGSAGASSYQPCPATGACKIMPFGDSITEGYPNGGGYRVELFRLAHQAGHAMTFVGSATNGPTMVDGVAFPRNHEGHGGYTIDDNAARNARGISPLVQASMRNYTPHIVTLMIGTNDINGNIDVSTAPNRLGALLDRIFTENANVLVVLAQIVPTRTDGTNGTIRTYNSAMPALVSARTAMGRHIVLVDMYAAFTRDANYKTALLGDNLHPNDAGYARMGETWYQAIVGYLR